MATDALLTVLQETKFQERGPSQTGPTGPIGPIGNAYSLPIVAGAGVWINGDSMAVNTNVPIRLPNYQTTGNAVSSSSAFLVSAKLSFFTPGNGQWQMTISRSTIPSDAEENLFNIVSGEQDLLSLPFPNGSGTPNFLATQYTSNSDANGNYVTLSASYIDIPGTSNVFYYELWIGYIDDASSTTTMSNVFGKVSLFHVR